MGELYRVRVGEDDYLGSAEEVLAFMSRAEGAPGRDPASFMEGAARRIAARLGVEGLPTSDPAAFLEALGERGILRVERLREPSDEREEPRRLLDEGPIVFGEGVEAEDLPD